jgi:hypothetical protein
VLVEKNEGYANEGSKPMIGVNANNDNGNSTRWSSLAIPGLYFFLWVNCFGFILLGCSVISVSFLICMLTLLLLPLAGLHFCAGLDFVTPSL